MILSIIVVHWNTLDLLRQCLSSLTTQTGFGVAGMVDGDSEIVVVDNGSTDGSPQMVRAEFPEVTLLCNETNLGFARANNQGIKASRGRYVLLLNSDTLVPPGTLTSLWLFMEREPKVGACGPQLVRPDGVPQPYAFGGDPTLLYLFWRGLNRLLFHRPLHDWLTCEVQRVDWVSGACLWLRRQALEQVGLLDEHFFMYFEDNDLCLRLRQGGWQVVYNPGAAITHWGGQSLRQNPAARRAYQESMRYFYGKHYGRLARWMLNINLWAYNRLVGLGQD